MRCPLILSAGAAFTVAALLAAACSSKSNAVALGGDCQLATDCEDGLICVLQDDGTRTCDNDLTKVENPAQQPGMDAGPVADAVVNDAPADTNAPPDANPPPPKDATPDTNPPPPKDSGPDTNPPPTDAAGE